MNIFVGLKLVLQGRPHTGDIALTGLDLLPAYCRALPYDNRLQGFALLCLCALYQPTKVKKR